MEVIGIDVSKEHLDLAVLDHGGMVLNEQRVANDGKALGKLIKAMTPNQQKLVDYMGKNDRIVLIVSQFSFEIVYPCTVCYLFSTRPVSNTPL